MLTSQLILFLPGFIDFDDFSFAQDLTAAKLQGILSNPVANLLSNG